MVWRACWTRPRPLPAGRPLDIDEAVFESERATGHRNRAIGHLLRKLLESATRSAVQLTAEVAALEG